MTKHTITFIGLDTHKEFSEVVIILDQRDLDHDHLPNTLVPSEHTSSDKRRLGPITKQGNTRARRLLVESAHSYRHQPKVSVEMKKRQEGLPQEIKGIAWQAQLRLCRRYQRLMVRSKHRNIVVVATAREMVGYLWEIIQLVPLEPVKKTERVTRVPR